MTDITWSWQQPDWPRFRYDPAALQWVATRYATESGHLQGGMAQLRRAEREDADIDLMVAEAISTTAIEGERLDRDSVRSSLRRQLGFVEPPRLHIDVKAENMAQLMLAARTDLNAPLTDTRLFEWQSRVVGDGRRFLRKDLRVGAWRDDAMQIVSGPVEHERVHYEAPPPERIVAEMTAFLDWFNATHPVNGDPAKRIVGPLRAAIAHLWFEIVHPFDDGNGRVGRAIAELCLAQDAQRPVLMSLSATLEKHREDYYQQINDASRTLDVGAWVSWFCERILEAQLAATETVGFVLKKARFWQRARELPLNDRQQKALTKMFAAGPAGFEGGMSARKYASLCECSKPTATRDLTELLALGCLKRAPGSGRSTRYELLLEA